MMKAKTVIGDRIAKGLMKAGVFVLHESNAIVPVQFGDLKRSGFVRQFGSGFQTDVVVGYTSEHAAIVHENPNAAHGREFNVKHAAEIARAKAAKRATAKSGMFMRGENQQFKYLETPCRTKRQEILTIIATEARR
jgi:hypothetical protein